MSTVFYKFWRNIVKASCFFSFNLSQDVKHMCRFNNFETKHRVACGNVVFNIKHTGIINMRTNYSQIVIFHENYIIAFLNINMCSYVTSGHSELRWPSG